jgi:hypothetical protein
MSSLTGGMAASVTLATPNSTLAVSRLTQLIFYPHMPIALWG